MDTSLPGIVVTGASGFVGRHFLASATGRYRLFCLARRSRREAGVADDENLRWTQADVARWDSMRQVVTCVKEHGGAEFVLHLAGYYDFKQMEHPEYDRTNVLGTRNVLKLAKQLSIKRFLFASSLAACRFPDGDDRVDEDTPPDADFAYARSKRLGEQMVREHSEWFPSSVLRLAAVYSDWCEYPPVYVFLKTWLSKAWNARILGGRGESAVTYIHIQDLMKFIHRVLDRTDELPRFCIHNASPDHTTSHIDLFRTATGFHFGSQIPPILMPRTLARLGVAARWTLGRMIGRPPFEAPWMVQYIDKKLQVNTDRTRAELDWAPTPRLSIERRLLVMIENMKTHQEAWRLRNEAALRRVSQRPNLVISELLEDKRDDLVDRIAAYVLSPGNAERFCNYHRMEQEQLRWFLTLVYQVLTVAVRTRDRRMVRTYAQMIAVRRRQEGFTADHVCDFLTTVGRLIADELRLQPELADLHQQIHDYVTLSFQLAADGVEAVYESMAALPSGDVPEGYRELELPTTVTDLQHVVHQLESICDDALPPRLRIGP